MDLPFNWDSKADSRKLRLGFLKAAFDEEHSLPEEKINDHGTLEQTARNRVFNLREVKLPGSPDTEAASLVTWFGEIGFAVGDDLIRKRQDALLTGQDVTASANLAPKDADHSGGRIRPGKPRENADHAGDSKDFR